MCMPCICQAQGEKNEGWPTEEPTKIKDRCDMIHMTRTQLQLHRVCILVCVCIYAKASAGLVCEAPFAHCEDCKGLGAHLFWCFAMEVLAGLLCISLRIALVGPHVCCKFRLQSQIARPSVYLVQVVRLDRSPPSTALASHAAPQGPLRAVVAILGEHLRFLA